MFDPPQLPAAGWYPDPYRPGQNRWWDGRTWHDPTPDRHSDALPDIGDWLGNAFSNALTRWRAVATVAVLTAAPATVFVALGIRRLTDGVVITEDEVTGWSNDRLPLSITALCLSMLFSYLVSVAIPVLMLRTVDGDAGATDTQGEIRAGLSAIGQAVRLSPRVIGWSLVLGVIVVAAIAVIVVLLIVAAPLGAIAMIAFAVAGVYYGIRLAFLTQAMIDRPGQPFTRSFDVVRDRWWAVLGRLILVGLIGWMISFGLQTVGGLVQGTGAGFGNDGMIIDIEGEGSSLDLSTAFPTSGWAIAVVSVTAVLTTVFVTSVTAAAFADLYRTRNPRQTTSS